MEFIDQYMAQQKKYHNTKLRQQLVQILQATNRPLTAGQLHQKLPEFNLASIYRSLHTLTAAGVIFSDSIESQAAYYYDSKPHHHIICRMCDATECIPCTHTLPSTSFTALDHQYTLTGVCAQCTNSH